MFYHYYYQNAYSYNSENMWFPLPQNRKLYIQGDKLNVLAHGEVYLVGFR